jgi:hypothetical protein
VALERVLVLMPPLEQPLLRREKKREKTERK